MARRGVLAAAASLLAVPSRGAGANDPRVRMVLGQGEVEIVVFVQRAPRSAGDFLRYVDAGAYDGGTITRVVRADNDHGATRIDVIQGGVRAAAPLLPAIAHESTAMTGLRHLDGTVSLPRDAPGTATGAAFFICIGDQPSLDAGGGRNPDRQGFAAFGHVTSGMEVVRAIWQTKANGPSPDAYTKGQMLSPAVAILSAQRRRGEG